MAKIRPLPDLSGVSDQTGGSWADLGPRPRVPLDRDGPFERVISWVARRVYGKVLDPLKASFHHRGALATSMVMEATAARWKKLPDRLQALAVMGSAREIGCSWCMDFGYWEFHHRGVEPRKLREIEHWETSDAYTPLERAVITYAVAATQTPSAVTDEMVEDLRPELSDAQIVELVALVSLENYRSRINAGLGLSSQGFKEQCDLPSEQAG